MTAEREGSEQRLFLVDGSNLLYRAFFAIRELTNSRGFPTNAVYGFTTMIMKLVREHRPDYLAVVFDAKGPTFRHALYEDYKATRAPMPDDLALQIPVVKEVVRGFSIPLVEREGVEADDIMGTLAKKASDEGFQVVLVSGDKDLMQLVSNRIIVMDTMKDKTYDVAAVKERFGVIPGKVVEILGLAGDSSDNIPGVPGIGEKTARKLVEAFGSIEEILKHVDDVKGEKLKRSLREWAEQARMSRELATIDRHLDLDIPLESLVRKEPDPALLKPLLSELEFSSVLQQIAGEGDMDDGRYRSVAGLEDCETLLQELRKKGRVACDFVFPRGNRAVADDPAGLALSFRSGEAWYISFDEQSGVDATCAMETLRPIFADQDVSKIGHDLKRTFILLARKGINAAGLDFDTMVAAYLLDPARRDYRPPTLASRYLNRQISTPEETSGRSRRAHAAEDLPHDRAKDGYCQSVDALFRLQPILAEAIRDEGFEELFRDIEMPLVEVLAGMEYRGVLVDRKLLSDMSRELGELMHLSEDKIYALAGERFNINSPKQLQIILFDKMGLPRGRRTKEGYSTDVDVLTHLARSYELPGEILAYRSLAKLRSTYVDALPELINPETGRIHTTYNQTATATGRLSSSDPNLQNIPIRTTEGKRIRQAFIAPEGWELLSSDYSQIELRILAHLSEDEELIAAFESEEDIHRKTASTVFGVFPAMVNDEMRRQAKVINFGVIYGMSPFGLSRELGITQKMAKIYIDEYFKQFRGVSRYIEDTIEQARVDGFVTTIMRRRRPIPEINSSVAQVRQFAERTAVNTPIQGSAADLIKIAMIRVARAIRKKKLSARMIMQVHDELVFEVPPDETEELRQLVKAEMEGVIEMNVPLVVNIKTGANWDEAH